MKKLLYLLYLLPVLGWAQDQNNVKTFVYRDSTTAGTARASATYFDGLGRPIQLVAGKMSNTGKDIITHIEYDAFGRQAKQYLPYASTASDLTYNADAPTKVLQYYSNTAMVQETTTNPYSEKFFEPSPLNRVLKQGAPGASWLGNADPYNNSDHTAKNSYLTNAANEVRKFSVTATIDGNGIYGTQTLNGASSYYDPGTLYKTVTKNENWTSGLANTTEEFKNKEGQVILKKTYNGTVAHETYYIYDQFGNLAYVLPPLCNGSATYKDNLGYQYKYDGRNRLAEKKLPEKQWEFIVYDKLDRVILTGPATSPFGGSAGVSTEVGWIMTIYDAYGRVAMTGWFSEAINSTARKNRQNSASFGANIVTAVRGSGNIDGVPVGYNNITSLPSTFKLLTVNYYDDYTWPGAPTVPGSSQVEGQNIRSKAKGLPTGTWVRVLTSMTETYGQLSYTLYDRRSRPVRRYTGNYLGGYTQVDSKLDFDGTLLYTKTSHKRSPASTDAAISIREDFTYDAQDRLTYHTHSINSALGQTLANITYNELGQLITKKMGNYAPTSSSLPTTVMQTIDYKYNVRGWLTDINDVSPGNLGSDLFAFKIAYNTVTDNANGALGNLPALYNGNISETYWRTSSDNTLRKYSYKYDDLNRLLNAYYQKPDAGVPYPGSYDESAGYDKNGNILSMRRKGAVDDPATQVIIDNLVYTYPANSNRLSRVDDNIGSPQGFMEIAGGPGNIDYTYDANGNILRDYNKGITTDIKYNHLNLPTEINIGSNKIVYLYDATGKKLKKTVTENGNTVYVDYLSGFQYKGGVLQFFPTAEGYVDNTVNSSGINVYNYVYQYKDHLGNVRVSFARVAGKNGTFTVGIKEENHYYPFGLKHLNYNVDYLEYQEIEGDIELYPPLSTTEKLANNYKYNGKEFQDELGFNIYDYGARMYDPALGRWMSIDPLAEVSRRWSPYSYCYDNPMYFVDPDGMWPWPSWNDLKKAAKGVGTGFVNFFTNAGTHVKNEVKALAKAYTSPTEFIKFSLKHHGLVIAAKAIANNITTPFKIVSNVLKGDYEKAGEAYGEHLATGLTAIATDGLVRGVSGLKAAPKTSTAGTTAAEGTTEIGISNPVPDKLARVVPADINTKTLGAPNSQNVFVTAAEDIKGLNASEIAEKLTIPQSSSGFNIFEFPTPSQGLSTPISSESPGFIGGGRTAGGAREYNIPNGPIPENATKTTVN